MVDNACKDRSDSGSYRIPIAVQFLWALILGTGLLFLPETPRYLIRQGRDEKAAKSLSRLRRLPVDNPYLIDELADIKANYEHELSLGTSSYRDFLTWHTLGKRLTTGCLLQSLQQLTGINVRIGGETILLVFFFEHLTTFSRGNFPSLCAHSV